MESVEPADSFNVRVISTARSSAEVIKNETRYGRGRAVFARRVPVYSPGPFVCLHYALAACIYLFNGRERIKFS